MSRTRDPLLIAVGVWVDRCIVWLTFVLVTFALLWTAIWERGLGRSWGEGVQHLQAVWHGQATPIVNVLCAITAANATLVASFLAVSLYAYWRRQGELLTHVRGSQLHQSPHSPREKV